MCDSLTMWFVWFVWFEWFVQFVLFRADVPFVRFRAYDERAAMQRFTACRASIAALWAHSGFCQISPLRSTICLPKNVR